MTAITAQKASVAICINDAADFDFGLWDLEAVSEESALALAKEVIENHELWREVHCAWIQVADETFHFDREELKGE